MLDEPQPLKETYGFATAGWNAAPTAAKVITRIAPLLDLAPRFDLPKADQLILAKAPAALPLPDKGRPATEGSRVGVN
jgi:hypothetical protein